MLADKWKVNESFLLLYNLSEQMNNTIKHDQKALSLRLWEDNMCMRPHARSPSKLVSPNQVQWKFADTLGTMKTSGIKKSLDKFQDILGIMKMCHEQDKLGAFESGNFDKLGSMNHHDPVKQFPAFNEPDFPCSIEDNVNFLSFLCTWQSKGGQGIQSNFDSESYPICIDTGATCCISTECLHFVLLDLIENVKITGIASRLAVKGMGIVKRTFMDDSSQVIEL